MQPSYFLTILCFLLALSACDEPLEVVSIPEPFPLECGKIKSKEELVAFREKIYNNRYFDSSQVVNNLIGEWGLIGTELDIQGYNIGQFCYKLIIEPDSLELIDMYDDYDIISDWYLRVTEPNGVLVFELKTSEEGPNKRMGMTVFSDTIMYGSGRSDDGAIFMYEKLK